MKRTIFIGLSLIFSCFCALFLTAPSRAESKEVTTILELCSSFDSNGVWLNEKGTCDDYTDSQTALETNRYLEFKESLTLKDVDIEYNGQGAPILVRGNSSVTINGGTYSSPNCFIWIQYDPSTKQYADGTSTVIDAGTFEATLSTASSKYAPSPVCVVDNWQMTLKDAKDAILNYLPKGYHFYDIETGISFETIPDEYILKGSVNADKNPDIFDSVWYLKSRIIAVAPNKEEQSSGSNNSSDGEKEEPEEEIENPNTLDSGILGYVVLFTISAVVLFTTFYRGSNQANTYKKHKQ